MIAILLHLFRLLPVLCGSHRHLALENLTVGRPSVNADIIALVRKMAAANPLWGAPRIHGELLKLGIELAERTVSRLIRKRRPPSSQTWLTFLTNHVRDLVSIDFFTVPTEGLRVLFVFVVLVHHRWHVLHFNISEHPTAHQIVDAFPDDTAPAYLLRDRDKIHGASDPSGPAGEAVGHAAWSCRGSALLRSGDRLTRRTFIHALTLAAAACPLTAGAQPARETARIGFLSPGDHPSRGWQADVLRNTLREHGWVEGKNLVIEYRFGGERYERLRALADDLVRLRVDLIFAASAPAAQAAKAATATVPIVFSTLNDPVRAGLVASFASPGGNMTGQAGLGSELDRKRLELLKEVVPSLSRATVLLNPSNPMTPQRLSEIEAAAGALNVKLRQVVASDVKDLDKAFQDMARARPAALIVVEDPLLIAHGRRIIDFSAEHRIPTIYGSPGWVEQGGLMEYSSSLREVIARAAVYVDRILRGAKPADLPVEQPTEFRLVINLKTAKVLGLTIPPSLRLRADRLVE